MEYLLGQTYLDPHPKELMLRNRVCSGSHLAVDLIPLGLVLYSLRRFFWSLGRAALARAAVAATGAIAGELSCERGWIHVLVHHVGAGAVIVAACVLISRAIRPQTFAP